MLGEIDDCGRVGPRLLAWPGSNVPIDSLMNATYRPHARHNNGSNWAYHDGHVAWARTDGLPAHMYSLEADRSQRQEAPTQGGVGLADGI